MSEYDDDGDEFADAGDGGGGNDPFGDVSDLEAVTDDDNGEDEGDGEDLMDNQEMCV